MKIDIEKVAAVIEQDYPIVNFWQKNEVSYKAVGVGGRVAFIKGEARTATLMAMDPKTKNYVLGPVCRDEKEVADWLAGIKKEESEEHERKERMVGIELTCIRESLGLTDNALAGILKVNPRTISSWQKGRDPIPYRVPSELEKLQAETEQAVEELVEKLKGEEEPVVFVCRNDREFAQLYPDSKFNARWWRQVALKAAKQVEGARIEAVILE
jgi:hypothetical protein